MTLRHTIKQRGFILTPFMLTNVEHIAKRLKDEARL